MAYSFILTTDTKRYGRYDKRKKTNSQLRMHASPKKFTLLHEIFATCLFRDFDVRIFRDT